MPSLLQNEQENIVFDSTKDLELLRTQWKKVSSLMAALCNIMLRPVDAAISGYASLHGAAFGNRQLRQINRNSVAPIFLKMVAYCSSTYWNSEKEWFALPPMSPSYVFRSKCHRSLRSPFSQWQ